VSEREEIHLNVKKVMNENDETGARRVTAR